MPDPFVNDVSRDDVLILVDGLDRPIGTASKQQAHSEGLLHRAFSVVLTRPGAQGTEILLAQRALGKYHSAGLWANACCSHPRESEEIISAAHRRVGEELGCSAQGLTEIGAFCYRAEFSTGLTEYEYDHVLVGASAGALEPDPREVGAVRWVNTKALARELSAHPHRFAAWAFTVLAMALAHIDSAKA